MTRTDTATVWHEFDIPGQYESDPQLTIRLSVGQHFHMTFPAGRTVSWEVVLDGETVLSGDDMRTPASPRTHDPLRSALALASFLVADAEHMSRCSGCSEYPKNYGYAEVDSLMTISDRLEIWWSEQ